MFRNEFDRCWGNTWMMWEIHESTCNGLGDIWWTDNPIYFSSIDSNATVYIALYEPLLTEHTQYCPCSTKQSYVILLCFSALTHLHFFTAKWVHCTWFSNAYPHIIWIIPQTQNRCSRTKIMILLNYTMEMLIVMTKLKSIIHTFFKLSQHQCQLGFIKSANL